MNSETVIVFTRNGMGDGPADLQLMLAIKFLAITLESGELPAKILFYTHGVRLACDGSPVLEQLRKLEAQGVELVLCQTCLHYFALNELVRVGVVGGMGDMLEAMQKATKVIHV